jgi:transposase
MALLEHHGVPEVWRRSIAEAVDVIDVLDARIGPLDHELGPLARADARVVLLDTIPGIGDLLGLTLASEIGDIARFSSPRKLIGYAGLAPKINQSGDRSRTGALSKAGSRTLRWAVVEAAQHAWRPSNPWHQLYTDLAARAGKNPSKSAVARKILIAAWHVLSRNEPFTARAARRQSCLGKLPPLSGRLTALHGIEKPRQLPRTLCADPSAEREMSSVCAPCEYG